MQKIDPNEYDKFRKKFKKFVIQLVCYQCKHKHKKKLACNNNSLKYLDLENNTCKKLEVKK